MSIVEELARSLEMVGHLNVVTPVFERAIPIRSPFWMTTWGEQEYASFCDRLASLVEMPGALFLTETGDLGTESAERLHRRKPAKDSPPRTLATATDRPRVDIQMPLEHKGNIPGIVLKAFTEQEIDFDLYVAPGPDFTIPPEMTEVFELIASGSARFGSLNKLNHRIAIGLKRNRLINRGTAPYVYVADADVVPPRPSMLKGFADALHQLPNLGSAGFCYNPIPNPVPTLNYHVGAGARMMRRVDWERIAPIRGAGLWCNCLFMDFKLQELGLSPAIPAQDVLGTHLFPNHRDPRAFSEAVKQQRLNPPPSIRRVPCTLDEQGKVDSALITESVAEYGTEFCLVVDG